MSLSTFLHSDFTTQRKKLYKWCHRNDWRNAHTPSFFARVKTEITYLFNQPEYIIVEGWLLKFYETKELYMNWGDDINVYMFERLTGKKIVPADKLLFKSIHPKYSCIGSVLPSSMDRNTVVWGSGCMDFDKPVEQNNRPKCITAVRGPLTRDYLLKNGIECPEVYGDPASLLPYIYRPNDKRKKYPITIIPHHRDWDDKHTLMEYMQEYLPDVHVINMTNYNNWIDIIDEIVHSEVVFSSSLHGLIVSDAYGVPNMFTEFMHHHPKYDKYDDYYQSIDLKSHTHTHTRDADYGQGYTPIRRRFKKAVYRTET